MADHTKPLLTSTYANFVAELDGRLDDLALGLDPATSTPTNVPTNAIRYSSASAKWQKWNGTAWVDLAASYAINISGSAASLSATLVATSGGTGFASYTTGDLLYASSSTAFAKLAGVATGNTLLSGGVGAAPAWGKVGLTTHISGTLAIANGGTNATSVAGARTSFGLGTADAVTFSDVTTTRAATPTQGYIYFGNTGTKYAGFDGTNFVSSMPMQFNINGSSTSCTGNAATATSASSASYANYLSSSNYIQNATSSGNVTTDFQNTPAGSFRYTGDTSTATNGAGGAWWFYQNLRHTNNSNYWGTQIAWGWEDNANTLRTRNVSAGTWTAWVNYLNSNNYNSYSPTLTGGGASGTWGISITGRGYPRRSDGNDLNFYWSGQSGQPTWLWGGSDGTNMYVYNPSNFSVNYAATAGSAPANGGTATYSTYLWATSHVGTYYLSHAWDGSRWNITTNHGSPTRVGWADGVAWTGVSGRPTALSQFSNDPGFTNAASGGASAFNCAAYGLNGIATVSLSKSGTTVVLNATANCNCACQCDCNCG